MQIANQLIKRSRQHLLAPGKLWEQPKPALIAALGDAAALHAAFLHHAGGLLGGGGGTGGTAGGAAGSTAADHAFAKYAQFGRRCGKLADMFGTVHAFSQLAGHTHIEGIAAVLAKFGEVGWPGGVHVCVGLCMGGFCCV